MLSLVDCFHNKFYFTKKKFYAFLLVFFLSCVSFSDCFSHSFLFYSLPMFLPFCAPLIHCSVILVFVICVSYFIHPSFPELFFPSSYLASFLFFLLFRLPSYFTASQTISHNSASSILSQIFSPESLSRSYLYLHARLKHLFSPESPASSRLEPLQISSVTVTF